MLHRLSFVLWSDYITVYVGHIETQFSHLFLAFVSGDLKQFESYYCEIEFGKAKRMETCDCKWVVKNVMEKTTAPIMSPVNFVS